MINADFELWKDIKGYEKHYQISNWGRVKSLPRWRKNNRNGYYTKEKILKQSIDGFGYHQVNLCKNNKCKMIKVHKLVANHFLLNPNNYPQVNHKDENKDNNLVYNLEWCTRKYNMNYGTRNKRAGDKLSKINSKIVYQYTLDGHFIKKWDTAKECRENGFNRGHIIMCCLGKQKTHKGFKWSYELLEQA